MAMKKTKDIHHSTFRKALRPYAIAPIALAISTALFLTGCEEKSDETVKIYQSAEQCIKDNPSMTNECVSSYQSAVKEAERTGPKYASREDCVAEFSEDACVANTPAQAGVTSTASQSQGSIWMPLMAGYMFGRMTGGGFANSPLFSGASSQGRFVDASGRSFGNSVGRPISVNKSALAPKPATTTTITRGGFGRSVAKAASSSSSRSSTSSSRSSSRSFGG